MYTKRPSAKPPFARFYLLVIGAILCLAAPNTAHAQVPTPLFGQQNALTQSINSPRAVYATDLNGDGFADVLSASAGDDKIAWYPNDGTGNFGTQQIITTNAIYAQSVYATDLDNDGDADVLSASVDDSKIAWYQNDGAGNFGTQQIITINAYSAIAVYATDLDNDGDADVLSASAGDNKIAWYQNDGAGNFGTQQIITTDANYATAVYATDLDNDGDADVLSASFYDNKIAWYQNDGAGNFGEQQTIAISANYATSVYATDLDNDGDVDVLSASWNDDEIAWYQNDGTGNFGSQQTIATNVISAQSVYATDLDNDGDADVLSASVGDDKIAWYANNGTGNFGEQQIITTNAIEAWSVYATDLDNDGDADVLSASGGDNKIAAYTNDGAANFSEEQIVIQALLTAPQVVCTADVDNDGFTDLVSASLYPSKLVWFKNKGDDTFNEPSLITNDISNASLVYTTDMDTDGDVDIVYVYRDISGGDGDDYIFWAENDGTGNFINFHNTYYLSYFITSFNISDLDNDGDVDIIVIPADNIITCLFNDGVGNFNTFQGLGATTLELSNLYTIDLDNNGYEDILVKVNDGASIIWFKNIGDTAYFPTESISTGATYLNDYVAADLNNDGNTDILWTGNNTVAWIPNNGDNTFGDSQIISNQATFAAKVLAVDVDNDGDVDVLSASTFYGPDSSPGADKIVWFSNNGNGTFAPEEVITTNVNYATSIATADLDNDGDLDLASASSNDSKVAWYENLLSFLPPPAATPPTASFNTYPTTTDTLYICQGQTVYFNNTSQNATNYNWTFGDGTQSNDSNPAHTFNTPGTHEVQLVAYTSNATETTCGLAVDDAFEVTNDGQYTLNLIENDFPCGNFTIQAVGYNCSGNTCLGGYGSITFNADGTALFGANSDFSGNYFGNISYNLITDYGTSTAYLSLNILEAPCTLFLEDVNATIIAGNSAQTMPLPITMSNCPQLPEDYSAEAIANNGTAYVNVDWLGENATLVYTPNPGFIGQDCFTYSITYQGTTYTANICITVTN